MNGHQPSQKHRITAFQTVFSVLYTRPVTAREGKGGCSPDTPTAYLYSPPKATFLFFKSKYCWLCLIMLSLAHGEKEMHHKHRISSTMKSLLGRGTENLLIGLVLFSFAEVKDELSVSYKPFYIQHSILLSLEEIARRERWNVPKRTCSHTNQVELC